MSAVIANYDVRRILIDNGSSTEVLLYDAFVRMNLSRSMLQESPAPLTGFGGNSVGVEGEIVLPVTIGMEPLQKTLLINFVVVRTTSPYNAILGRPALNKFRAIMSTYHLLAKFLTMNGVRVMRGDRWMAKQCLTIMNQ